MPSVYDLKPAFQRMLRPLVTRLVAAGVTPNHVTLAAIAGSVAVGATLGLRAHATRWLLLLPVWLLLRMALNAMDGIAAREHDLRTRLGGALNEVGDVVSDLAIYLPLALVLPGAPWPAIAFTLGAVLTEFCGVLGPALGGSRRYDGPMGKSDRAALVGVLGLVGSLAPQTLRWWPAILWVASGAAVLTCWKRVSGVLAEPARSHP